jgi:hypothetical protein
MTPEQLLEQAKALTSDDVPETRGYWPRASALLGRMALEAAMSDRLQAIHPDLPDATARSQLLCLDLCVDHDLASEATIAWAGLSSACHEHAYELAPTVAELTRWLTTVDRLLQGLEGTCRTSK